jgi:hypothetical protein
MENAYEGRASKIGMYPEFEIQSHSQTHAGFSGIIHHARCSCDANHMRLCRDSPAKMPSGVLN